MSAVRTVRAGAESVSAKRRKLDGSVTDRCQADERVVARTIDIQPLPDFKLIFKIQPFCVCSSDSGTKHALCLFFVPVVIEMFMTIKILKNLWRNVRSRESKVLVVLGVFNERLKESKLGLRASEAGILLSGVFVRPLSVSAHRVWDIFYIFLFAKATQEATAIFWAKVPMQCCKKNFMQPSNPKK